MMSLSIMNISCMSDFIQQIENDFLFVHRSHIKISYSKKNHIRNDLPSIQIELMKLKFDVSMFISMFNFYKVIFINHTHVIINLHDKMVIS